MKTSTFQKYHILEEEKLTLTMKSWWTMFDTRYVRQTPRLFFLKKKKKKKKIEKYRHLETKTQPWTRDSQWPTRDTRILRRKLRLFFSNFKFSVFQHKSRSFRGESRVLLVGLHMFLAKCSIFASKSWEFFEIIFKKVEVFIVKAEGTW